MLANLDRFFALPIRGIHFSWTSTTPGVGVVEARFEGPDVPDGALHVLRLARLGLHRPAPPARLPRRAARGLP